MSLETGAEYNPEGKSSERLPYAGNILTLKDLKGISGRNVLVRSDLDFKPGEEKSSRRFKAVKPTVEELEKLDIGRIILLAHNGDKSSLANLQKPLEDLLGESVIFTSEIGGRTNKREIILFENTRFWPGEEANDAAFAKLLVKMGDIYIGNAFATSHRAHASMVGIPSLLQDKAAGLQVEEEVAKIDEALSRPKEGFVAVIGGAKIKTKLPVIQHMAKIAETVLVGGMLPLEIRKDKAISDALPKNVIVADLDESRGNKDITLKSADEFAKILSKAKTVVWNGAMGVFEEDETAQGTLIIVRAMRDTKFNNNAFLLAGGGETEAFLKEYSSEESFDHISTGGGAMLEYVSGKRMPALEALRKS